MAKYGKTLLCVRNRYDKVRGVRLKTVEIVVEEKPWPPSPQYGEEDVIAIQVVGIVGIGDIAKQVK